MITVALQTELHTRCSCRYLLTTPLWSVASSAWQNPSKCSSSLLSNSSNIFSSCLSTVFYNNHKINTTILHHKHQWLFISVHINKTAWLSLRIVLTANEKRQCSHCRHLTKNHLCLLLILRLQTVKYHSIMSHWPCLSTKALLSYKTKISLLPTYEYYFAPWHTQLLQLLSCGGVRTFRDLSSIHNPLSTSISFISLS